MTTVGQPVIVGRRKFVSPLQFDGRSGTGVPLADGDPERSVGSCIQEHGVRQMTADRRIDDVPHGNIYPTQKFSVS